MFSSMVDAMKARNGSRPSASCQPAFLMSTSNDDDSDSASDRDLHSTMSRLQTLLVRPSSFLDQIARQTQMLACLKWLGDFQILACIPVTGSAQLRDVAALAGVPSFVLGRVARMMATAGFFYEPAWGVVAHTQLSAAFATDFSYFDAAMLIARQVIPSSLPSATSLPDAANIHGQTPVAAEQNRCDFAGGSQEALKPTLQSSSHPRFTRQWRAYRELSTKHDGDLREVLEQLDWQHLRDASVVHICPEYVATAPALVPIEMRTRMVIQTYTGPSSYDEGREPKVRLQTRAPGQPQTVRDAAVYIMHPGSSALGRDGDACYGLLISELRAHVQVLRRNPSGLLILAPPLLPEPGSVSADEEGNARVRDLVHMHLANEVALEVPELVALVEEMGDSHGVLVVAKRMRTKAGAVAALAVQYRHFGGVGVDMEGGESSSLYGFGMPFV